MNRVARIASLVTVAIFAVACAKLEVGVDVYKGNMILSPEKRLDVAMAGARYGRAYINEYLKVLYAQELGKRNKVVLLPSGDETAEYMHSRKETIAPRGYETLVGALHAALKVYETDKIEELWGQLQTMRNSNAAEASVTRTRLVHALTRFGKMCEDAGQQRAGKKIAAYSILRGLFGALDPLTNLFLLEADPSKLEAGVALEQIGMRMQLLANDPNDVDARTPISQMMQSQAPGLVASSLKHASEPTLLWKILGAPGIFPGPPSSALLKGLDDSNWSEINKIHVDGIAETNFVLAKDEIGNWHIKTAELNQADVTNAVFDGTTALVKVAAAAYGVPLPGLASGGGGAAGKMQPENLSTVQQMEFLSVRADRVRSEVAAARRRLETELTSASQITEPKDDPAKRTTLVNERIALAVNAYKAAIERIGPIEIPTRATPPPPVSDTNQLASKNAFEDAQAASKSLDLTTKLLDIAITCATSSHASYQKSTSDEIDAAEKLKAAKEEEKAKLEIAKKAVAEAKQKALIENKKAFEVIALQVNRIGEIHQRITEAKTAINSALTAAQTSLTDAGNKYQKAVVNHINPTDTYTNDALDRAKSEYDQASASVFAIQKDLGVVTSLVSVADVTKTSADNRMTEAEKFRAGPVTTSQPKDTANPAAPNKPADPASTTPK